MIIKIKTFSGDVLCLPEEDYLQELMYSDSPEERDFARSDYEGLDPEGVKELMDRRRDYAKSLRHVWRKTQDDMDLILPGEYTELKGTWTVDGGNIKSRGKRITRNSLGLTEEDLKKHLHGLNTDMQGESRKSAKIMRDEVLENVAKRKKALEETAKRGFQEIPQKRALVPVNSPVKEETEKAGRNFLKKFYNNGKLTKTGKLAAGTAAAAAAAGLTYGGYKLYKHHKDKKQQQENDSKD